MESKELRKRLRSLGTVANSRFHYLNNGGCCVFAAAVAGELERLGVECEVISTGFRDQNLKEIRNYIPVNNVDEWNAHGVKFNHVGVRLRIDGRWHTYDSDVLKRSKFSFGNYDRAADGGITAKEAKELADDAKAWNPTFDRKDVPAVRRLVREMMRAPM